MNNNQKHPFLKLIEREYLYSDLLGMGSWGIQLILLIYLISYVNSQYVGELLFVSFLITGISYFVIMQQKTLFKRIFTSKKYFDVLGNDVLSQRFFLLLNTRRRFLKIFILSFVIALIFGYISSTVNNNSINVETLTLLTGIVSIPAGILYIHQILINRFRHFTEFDFYLAKACFDTIAKYPEYKSPAHSRLINNGIIAYGMFLKNAIKMDFSKPASLYLKILSESKNIMLDKIQEMNQILDSEDRLDFLRYLQKIIPEHDMMLVYTRTSKIVVEILPIILGPIVTISIFIASYYLNPNFILK